MTSRVLKYTLSHGKTSHQIPAGSTLLSVQDQRGEIQLWALVHDRDIPEHRVFRVVATGQPFENDVRDHFIGTVVQLDGELVFHVFEVFQ